MAATSKILIVEDEVIVAKDIQKSLEKLGYTIADLANSGREAITKAANTKPDLVLMDIRLKEQMNGVQAAEQIWNSFNIPVVFLTAHSDINTLRQAKAAEPFGYITKPFRERELHTAIDMAIYRHQLEKKLKDREQWLHTILNSIGDAVIAVNNESYITLINPVAAAMTGWKQEEAVGKNVAEVLHLVNEETHILIESPVKKALEQGVVVGIPEQTLLITKNGIEIPIDDSAAPIKDEQAEITGVVVAFRDITERKEAEKNRLAQVRNQQLEAQMAELERLNRLKSDFLSTVSHELRSPMTNIRMAVKMLELSLGRMREFLTSIAQQEAESNSAARYLQILKDECGREINLIDNILDLQRLEAGVQSFAPEAIQFQTWLPQLVEPFQERAISRQQSLQVDIPTNLPAIVSDSASVERILAELLHNACKYTPPGECITVTATAKKEKIQLQVSNSGVEIPTAELPHIFEKFYRVPSHDLWKQGGTGLGLALIQKLIEQLGGWITVRSGLGETCFTIEFPLQM